MQFSTFKAVLALAAVSATASPVSSFAADSAPIPGLSSGTVVAYSSSSSFAQDTARWSSFDAPSYQIYAKPALVSDVQKLVKYAVSNNISFLATGGGHGFATSFANVHNGLKIDLSGFNTIQTNAEANTMTVGGGVTMGDVIEPLFKIGKMVPTGSEKCVGFLGGTLGGGVSRWNGLFGMMIDSLLSVELVTANGELIQASKSKNADLFWAIQGAGFQYGIVTSAVYQIHDIPNNGNIVNADFLFGAAQAEDVFKFFESMSGKMPAELAVIAQVGYAAAYGGVYIAVNAGYFGSNATATQLVQPLLDAKPEMSKISTVPYDQFLSTAFFGTEPATAPCPKNGIQNVWGVGLKNIDVPTFQNYFQNLTQLFESDPDTQGTVFFIESFPNQAALQVPSSSTSYPHRDITTHLLLNFDYTDLSKTNTINEFARNARSEFAATSGFDSLQVYVSYGHGDEASSVLYGGRNLGRLGMLKMMYDPFSRFSFNQPFRWY